MLTNQLDWGNLYDHIMGERIFTLIMNKVFCMSSKSYEANGYMHNCIFHMQCEVGYKEKNIQLKRHDSTLMSKGAWYNKSL